jgi:hypothetical protein
MTTSLTSRNVSGDFRGWPSRVPLPVLILAGSFLTLQIVQLVLLTLYEKVEYDTFTFYFSKVELLRWQTLTGYPNLSSVQEFLPIGYSKLQALFANGGYAKNGLNFIVAMGVGAYLSQYIPRLFIPFAFLTLANTAFFMQYTGYKTDAPLAALSIALIHVIGRPYFRFQLSVICILSLVILSIKWSGGLVVLTAGFLYISNFSRELRAPSAALALDLLAAVVVFAILFSLLDLGIYVETYKKTGSFTPTEAFGVAPLSFDLKNLAIGMPQYLLVSIVETFEPLWRRLLQLPWLGNFLQIVTLGAKDHVVISPGQIRQSINVFDGCGIVASVLVLVRWYRTGRMDVFVRNCAIAALVVTAVTLLAYPYQPFWANRYFLPAQVLSYVPLAYLAMMGWYALLKHRAADARRTVVMTSAVVFAGAHLAISGYMLVRDHERNLIVINDTSGITTKQIEEGHTPPPAWRKPIYRDTAVEQAFRGWQGFQTVYMAMLTTVTSADRLEIVTDTRAADVDYTYPFLRVRYPSNTTFSNLSSGFRPRSPNVLCFSTTACREVAVSGAYTKVADQGPTIALWRFRHEPAAATLIHPEHYVSRHP